MKQTNKKKKTQKLNLYNTLKLGLELKIKLKKEKNPQEWNAQFCYFYQQLGITVISLILCQIAKASPFSFYSS